MKVEKLRNIIVILNDQNFPRHGRTDLSFDSYKQIIAQNEKDR